MLLWLLLVVALLARYDRRDLFSHWIRKDQPANRPCTHACCRGMRAHPEGYPVTKRRAWLRAVSDEQVAEYYGRHGGDNARDQAARDQALAEMQRRDLAQERRERTEERRRARWAASKTERWAVIEYQYVQAEAATSGYMLNRRGREAGVDPRTLFTGPEARARKYASEELMIYWQTHARPTEAMFEGRDTRIDYTGVSAASRGGPRQRMTREEQEWRERFERSGREMAELAG